MKRRDLLRASGAGILAVTGASAAPAAWASDAPDASRAPDTRAGVRLARKLIAGGPDPEHAEALQLFGQFVGSWKGPVTEHFGDRSPYVVEWHFGWILHGRGIQDVFGELPPSTDRGTTIRIYDPVTGRWSVSWFGPHDRSFHHFEAGQVGEEIVQTGAFFNGFPMRWIFSDISRDSFHWRNEIAFDGGATWTVVQEMDATRTAPR